MNIYQELTPLKVPDVFVVIDSCNNGFDYPIHNHSEFELNMISGMSGARIVGDSTERYTDCDLVLLGPYLYHKWDGDLHLQNNGQSYRVITIQFSSDLFNGQFFRKERFFKIRNLLKESSRGIKFYGKTREEAMQLIINLTEDKGFANVIVFFQLLDLLSRSAENQFLSSEGFSAVESRTGVSGRLESNRIQVAYSYILKNFTKPELKISDVAGQLNMGDSAFSHFFQKYAFRSFTQFLVDVRLGHACKLLLDTDQTVGEICYKSGFNNVANFNRLFKKYRNRTPVAYRQSYIEKNDFDQTHQLTPWQFVPAGRDAMHRVSTVVAVKPSTYATRLVHI